MLNNPVESIDQAKKYFVNMGCSHFHMAREYPDRYDEYALLNISKKIENEWRIEQFEEYYNSIIENHEDICLWLIHSNMAELAETLKVDIILEKILEVTQNIKEKVPFDDRVIVSESINGRKSRKFRSGLIYLAYDLGYITIAKTFVELSLYNATYVEQKRQDLDRCNRACKLCNDIRFELGI